MKKKWMVLAASLLAAAAFAFSPLAPYVKSLAVMKVYSYINEKDSLMADRGIEIEIPGGGATEQTDWYPFVMTFNADSRFSSFTGNSKDRLTIMYNFPAFDLSKGCSRLFDSESPYYNGFYGAYVAEGTYGFNRDGSFNGETASVVPRFDMMELVMKDMGMSFQKAVFEWEETGASDGVTYAGSEGWICIDADLEVNGALHEPEENYQNYIQYGRPGYDTGSKEDFAPVAMKGRIYARYFEEKDCSIYFYILARTEEVLEACDREILSESRIYL